MEKTGAQLGSDGQAGAGGAAGRAEVLRVRPRGPEVQVQDAGEERPQRAAVRELESP